MSAGGGLESLRKTSVVACERFGVLCSFNLTPFEARRVDRLRLVPPSVLIETNLSKKVS